MKEFFAKYTSASIDIIASEFNSNIETGLSQSQAEIALQKYGKNTIHSEHRTWWQILFNQVKSPFIYILFIAAALAYFLGEKTDALLILLFILINTSLGFFYEFKSNQTAKLLKKLISSKVDVLRSGEKTNINGTELVPGDIVYVSPGDIIQADCRLLKRHNLLIDESILTGEAEPQSKIDDRLEKQVNQVYKAKNILFSGTTVVSGSGEAIVIGTGKNSYVNSVSKLASQAAGESTFEKGISQFSSFILKMIGATLLLMLLANIAIKGTADLGNLVLFTIALAVSVVPEALPLVTTFSLSKGALNLSKKKVIVKRLSAIEDMGSIDVLCTDKTGTITENVMTIIGEKKIKDSLYIDALMGSALMESHDAKHLTNSFDIAIHEKANKTALNHIKTYQKVDELPFDPEVRINTVLIKKASGYCMVVRGAPEAVLAKCSRVPNRDLLERWIEKEGSKGRRVLAIARKEIGSAPSDLKKSSNRLTLSGLLSFEDPLKKTAKEAIQKAESLGVAIKVLTGDRADVATAIGIKVGLIESDEKVITGEEFEKLNLQEKHKAAEAYAIFARVTPKQKYEIIELLKEKHEVGFLGEGINDAPALKVANVGIVVDDASDIGKEVADIILLNKSLHTIIDGIAEGRSVFANTVKYIKATLASNFGNFYAVAVASLFITYLPLLPVQILLVNLLSDFPMISIATDKVDHTELKKPRAYPLKEIAFSATILGVVSSAFDFLTFAVFFKLAPAVLQSNWFMESILTELLLIYSIRSRRFIGFSLFKNAPSWEIIVLTVGAGAATIILPFTEFGHRVLEFVSPTVQQFGIVIAISVGYLIATETTKLLIGRVRK